MKKILLFFCMFYFVSLTNAQISFDGNISESAWGVALSTSSGGPSPGFGSGHEINAIYAIGDDTNIYLAVAGNVQSSNRILVFIDSRTGGFTNGTFDKTSAPQGIDEFNSGTTFDPGFEADYCLVIGTDGMGDYFFDLFTLSSSTGSNNFLGSQTTSGIGANPANSSTTQGFEVTIPKADLGYTGGDVELFAAYISDGGFLSNQFLTPAGSSDGNYGNGGVSFESATPSPVTAPASQLPVELVTFSATPKQSQTHLSWQTASEENNSHFNIEASTDGRSFEKIGVVEGAGWSNEVLNYEFVDESPARGTNYYRLQQVDFDGTSSYSEIVSVEFEKIGVEIFPNPVVDVFSVSLEDVFSGTLEVYDLQGRLIQRHVLDGHENKEISLREYTAGLYLVRLLDNNGQLVTAEKLIKR